MKIKRLQLKNFAMFNDFELVFNKQITRLVGVNGSGKTTVGLNSIWACFKGIAEKGKDVLIGERYRFIGKNGKSADINILLIDERSGAKIEIKRKITSSANQISFESSEDSVVHVTKEYIENLFNTVFLSAKHFCSLSGRAQAISLGIDTSSFDVALSKAKEDAKGVRRDLKAMGEIAEVEKVDKVSLSKLLEERDGMQTTNAAIRKEWEYRESCDYSEDLLNKQINDLTKELDVLKEKNKDLLLKKQQRGHLQPEIDYSDIDAQIANSEQINIQAQRYQDYLMRKDVQNSSKNKLNQHLIKQGEISTEKSNYIKSFKFNIKNLNVNEDGELSLNGKIIREPYFSRGELEMIVARIVANLNPELKIRFVEDFDIYDEANQEKLIKNLLRAGFQLITAEVGDEIVKDNSVLLRECKIVERSEK